MLAVPETASRNSRDAHCAGENPLTSHRSASTDRGPSTALAASLRERPFAQDDSVTVLNHGTINAAKYPDLQVCCSSENESALRSSCSRRVLQRQAGPRFHFA